MFPLLVVAAAVLVFAVWRDGTKLVLDSNAGVRTETITDPNAPGYRAFVNPTPTMLIAHLSTEGELDGVTVLAQTALDQGGTALLITADLLLEPSSTSADGDLAILARTLYHNEGLTGLRRRVGEFLGFGFSHAIELAPTDLRNFLRFVEPLELYLPDDLTYIDTSGRSQVAFAAGDVTLSAEQAATVYGWLNPNEFDANRTQRQLAFWEAWLSAVNRLATSGTYINETAADGSLAAYLISLGTGRRNIEVLPLQVQVTNDTAIYVQTPEQKQALAVREMVPLPLAPYLGARPRVALLDGSGNSEQRDSLLPELIDAGAEVTVIGNALEFGVTETTVAYHLPAQESAAQALATAIGASPIFVEDPNSVVDITVTVGLGRLDS